MLKAQRARPNTRTRLKKQGHPVWYNTLGADACTSIYRPHQRHTILARSSVEWRRAAQLVSCACRGRCRAVSTSHRRCSSRSAEGLDKRRQQELVRHGLAIDRVLTKRVVTGIGSGSDGAACSRCPRKRARTAAATDRMEDGSWTMQGRQKNWKMVTCNERQMRGD